MATSDSDASEKYRQRQQLQMPFMRDTERGYIVWLIFFFNFFLRSVWLKIFELLK